MILDLRLSANAVKVTLAGPHRISFSVEATESRSSLGANANSAHYQTRQSSSRDAVQVTSVDWLIKPTKNHAKTVDEVLKVLPRHLDELDEPAAIKAACRMDMARDHPLQGPHSISKSFIE